MTVVDTGTAEGQDHTQAALQPNRRSLLLGCGAAAAALGVLPAWSRTPPVLASGHVFHDRSGSGMRRWGDPGIPGVLVSNGRDVVRTDEDGRWQLALQAGESAFVIKPPSWMSPLGRGGVPDFSYLHQPDGSPAELNLQYRGVSPTGPLPRKIDFPLRPADERDAFEVLMIADPQPQNGRELSYLSADLSAVALDTKAAFAIVHGDVAFDDLTLYPRYLDIIGATGLPWHHCPGNHDMNAEATDTRFAFETWKQTFGPCHYAFQQGRATFFVLSNVSRTRGGERNYGAEISADQLAFVRNVLAHVPRDQLIVLSMHIPLMSRPDVADPVPHVEGGAELMRLLSPYAHTVSFSGHTHTTEHHYLGVEQGYYGAAPHHHHVLATASGCWWGGPRDHRNVPIADCQDGSPRGVHVLEVDGKGYSTRFVASSRATETVPMRLTIEAPGVEPGEPIPRHKLREARLFANVFDGGPRTLVGYRIGGINSGLAPMQREFVADPSFARLHAAGTAQFRDWVKPVVSSHLWCAGLPATLDAGAYRVEVALTDEYGRRRTASILLEVEGAAPEVHAAAKI